MTDASSYALGYTDLEHDRLIRQAQRLQASTDGFFRAAGVGEGMRVLDLGSGIGDVAMLVARIVGPTGEVVGVERDPRSVRLARARAGEAAFANVTFIESDVAAISDIAPFDAVVGRFILQWLPDPVNALRSTRELLRPNGIVAFQEVSWSPSRAANAHLPLWSACASIVFDTIKRSGARPDMGLLLHRVFREAGLPEPALKVDMQMSAERKLMLWVHDLFVSTRADASGDERVPALGDLATLADRIEAEARTFQSAVASITVVGAVSHAR